MSQEKKVNLFLRFRPLMPIENFIPEEEKSSIININSDNTVNLENNKSFKFDRIFDIGVSEQEIFTHSTKDLIKNAFNGKICSIICYGYNCTGKTYTTEQIITNAMKEIYKSDKSNYTLKISYFEFYLNELIDLLDKKTNLVVNENGIKDLTLLEVKNLEMFNEIYNKGKTNRIDLHYGNNKHKMNTNVFNSSSVLTLNIFKDNNILVGKIFFIDLGGKTKLSSPGGISFKEGTSLNTSLDNFNEVIKSLSKKENLTFRQDKFLRSIKQCFDKDSYLTFIFHCVNIKRYKNENLQTLEMSKFIAKINS